MTVSSPHLIENKLDRLIDDMRFLKAQMLRFDQRLKEIEVHGLLSKLSEQQQPESKSRLWIAAAGRAAARTILTLFAVGAGTGAVLHYLGT